MSRRITTPDELESLTPGSEIDDGGLRATKTDSGTWHYDDGKHWEPGLPTTLVYSAPTN